jgi:hypothetical protein
MLFPTNLGAVPQRPHFAVLLHWTLEVIPGAYAPSLSLLHRRPTCISPWIVHWHSTRCRPSASSALLLPRTPRTVPAPRFCWTVTSAPARMHTASTYWTRACTRPLILCLHLQSVDLAPHVRPSSHFRLPLFTVHLTHTVPTSVLHASHASPPHPLSLHPSRSRALIWLSSAFSSAAASVVLDSGSQAASPLSALSFHPSCIS